MVTEPKKVWSLGTKIEHVDRHISWKPKEVPSFAECDILIVDTSSLNEKLMDSMDIDMVSQLYEEIKKRFDAENFSIICIISENIEGSILSGIESYGNYVFDNYFWCPLGCDVVRIGKGSGALKNTFSDSFLFKDYANEIKQWEIAIQTTPCYKSGYNDTLESEVYLFNPIATKSNDILGGQYYITSLNESVIFLPPLKTSEKSIQKILKILGDKKSTSAPNWVEKIIIPGTEETMKKIKEFEKQVSQKQADIKTLQDELINKNQFKKLLYATDDELEIVVKQAFELLNLNKVKRGEPGKDDLTFEPTISFNYGLCSVEIKGVEGNIKLKYLRQLNNWVEDHLENKVTAKGIIVANTFRLTDIKQSKSNRSKLDNDNLKYAKKREFCIIPTHVLLDLCAWILDGNSPDTAKIEKALLETIGFVTLKDLKP